MENYTDFTHDQLMNICNDMKKYGGSFESSLADCFYKADTSNKNKLKDAFPEYFKKKVVKQNP